MEQFLPHPGRGANAATLPPAPVPAEEELHWLFTRTLGLLCIAGFDGYFKLVNPAWSATLGWTSKELQSRPFMEFVHPDDRAATHSEMEGLLEGSPTVAFENRYRCPDGSYKWLQWSADSSVSRRRIYATAHDITARKELEKSILETADREKERLGRELHDGLCQNLAGIAALSASLARKLAAVSPSSAAEAREIAKLINETIGHARDMARGLNPVNLEDLGITTALESLASNVDSLFHVSCTFACPHADLRFGAEVEAHLCRIAQEAVHNAVNHGRGEQIEISLSMRDGLGHLSIRDDGVGIDPETLASSGSGLHNMDSRARLIGGTMRVRPRSMGGTKVICSFPLPPDQPRS